MRETTGKNRRGSIAGLGQVRVTVGRRVARSGTIACRSTCMSYSATDTQRAGERNHRIAGIALGSGERNQWMGKNNSQAMEVVGILGPAGCASLINEADAKRRCVEPMS